MKFFKFVLLLITSVLGTLATVYTFANADEDYTNQTRFGTYGWFRTSTGNPNFINGSVYSPIDDLNKAKHKFYNPIMPDGQPAPMSNDPKELALTQPDVATYDWWVYQVKQMDEVELDFVIYDTLGMRTSQPVCDDISKHPDKDPSHDPFQPDYAAKALTKVLNDPTVGSHLKVGLNIEGGPAYRAYNWDRLASQGTQNLCPNPFNIFKDKSARRDGTIVKFPITAENVDRYYYDLSVKPFFDNLPKNLWLTHNGKPVDQGGRPVIIVYGPNGGEHTGFENAGAAWAAFKARFQRDYGVEPFLIMSTNWFRYGARDDLKQVADAMNGFIGDWIRTKGPSNPPAPNTWQLNGYTMAAVSPGIKAEVGHWSGKVDYILGKRWEYVDGTEGPDESYFLQREWDRAMQAHPNLVIIGMLDAYEEGQQFTRMANYEKKNPSGPGDYLPPDYYIKKLQQLIGNYRNKQ